ncbi:MAG: GyrI-like domain-containing protein [Fusobacteriaceae bacterium]|nr:GyrI-like domain-containing protein [Fusobacteriaceae bacterium]
MEFKIVKRDEIKLIGLKEKIYMGSNTLTVLWGKLLDRKHEIKNLISENCYGVAENFVFNPHLSSLEETVSFEVRDFSFIPEGMVTKVLKPQTYLVFTHKGPLFTMKDGKCSLEKTYENIYFETLPKSGYRVDHAFNFEYYDERFKHEDPSSEFDIYIPIKEE